jgi:hypothetical protein
MDMPERDENGSQENDGQNWRCGPMGFWPLLAFVPVGVSWDYWGDPVA